MYSKNLHIGSRAHSPPNKVCNIDTANKMLGEFSSIIDKIKQII